MEKKERPTLIVMLTNNDFTVENAEEVFEQCKYSKATCWGFKEKPLPIERMRNLFSTMRELGKTTFLEVVSYSEEEGLEGAKIASECGCDFLMGTKFFPSIARFCKSHSIKYLPFVGEVSGRPSVLSGNIAAIIEEAKNAVDNGAYGIDLLGYRFTGDPQELNRALVEQLEAPVCIAGSIGSFSRLDELKDASPKFFTIGSAFFDNKFDGSFDQQINKVCDYMQN